MAQNNRADHIALVASRPDDAPSRRFADSGSASLANGQERPVAHSLKQTTPQTAGKPRSPEQEIRNAQGSDSCIRAELTKQAMLAIEYCPETASAWATVQKLPRKYQDCFLQIVGAKPQQDARKLAAILLAKYRKVLKPYRNDEANNALASARTISAEAEAEFMIVYDLLGEKVKPAELLQRIETKFGPSRQTLLALEQEKEAREQRAQQQEAHERAAQEKAAREQEAREQEAAKRQAEERKTRERDAREQEDQERRAQEALLALKALEVQMQVVQKQAASKRKRQEALDRQALRAQEALVRNALAQEVGGRYPGHIRSLALSALLLPLLAAAISAIK